MRLAVEHHSSTSERRRRVVLSSRQAGAGIVGPESRQEVKDRARDRAGGRRELSVRVAGGIAIAARSRTQLARRKQAAKSIASDRSASGLVAEDTCAMKPRTGYDRSEISQPAPLNRSSAIPAEERRAQYRSPPIPASVRLLLLPPLRFHPSAMADVLDLLIAEVRVPLFYQLSKSTLCERSCRQ